MLVSNSSASANPDYLVWTDELVDPVSSATVQKQIVGIVDATAGGTTRAAVGANGLAVSATIVGSVTTGGLTDTQLRATAVPVSAASLPLPTGAATAAKQPALGTAGTASTDVISVQGIAGGTAIPVSGTISVTGTMPISIASAQMVDGASANIGALADAASASTLTGLLKNIKAALAGTLTVTGGGGGSQFAEDVASVGGELMTLAGAVRSDAPTTTTSTDGDYANLKTDSIGRLWVQVGASALPTGAATAAKQPALGTAGSASTDVITIQGIASGTVVPVSGTVTTTPPANASTNITQVAGSAIAQGHGTAATAIRVELPTDGTGIVGLAAGTNAIGKLSANGGVIIGDVNVVSDIPGVGATSLGKAEDAAHSSGDTGVFILAVRNDAGGALAGTTGDYIPLTTNSAGALYVTGGGGGTQYVEDVASTGGETMTIAGVVRQDTLSSSTSTDGDYAYMKVTAAGSLYVADAAIETAMARTAVVTDGSSKDWQEIVNGYLVAGVPQAVDSTHGLPQNIVQVAGTALDVNSGNKSAGTIRVVLATDQPNLTSALNVALAANQSVNVAQINGVTPLMGAGNTGTGSLRVTIATDQTALTNALKVDGSAVTQPVSQANPVQSATATLANVAGSVTSVTLQALNAARKGLVIVNDSTSILYVKFGSTASTTSYTYFMNGSIGGVPSILELPAITYTGIVTGIWVAATGSARMTEIT